MRVIPLLKESIINQAQRSPSPASRRSTGPMPKTRSLDIPVWFPNHLLRRQWRSNKSRSGCLGFLKGNRFPFGTIERNRIVILTEVDLD